MHLVLANSEPFGEVVFVHVSTSTASVSHTAFHTSLLLAVFCLSFPASSPPPLLLTSSLLPFFASSASGLFSPAVP